MFAANGEDRQIPFVAAKELASGTQVKSAVEDSRRISRRCER